MFIAFWGIVHRKDVRISKKFYTVLKLPFSKNSGSYGNFVLDIFQNYDVRVYLINPKRPGRFCNFSKNWIKIIQIISISTTTRTRETNYSAFEMSGIGLSFWSGEPLSPRAPSFRTLVSFSGTAAARGLVVTTKYYWDLLRKNLMCKSMGLAFAMGQDFLRKVDFAKNRNLEKNPIFRAKNSFFSVLEIYSLFLMLVPFKPI